jgi:hypothetical protein
VEVQPDHPAVVRFKKALEQAETTQVPYSQHFPFRVSQLLALEPVLRHVMAIAMWNAEVCNGGIDQWLENGNSCTFPYLLAACDAVGTPNAKRVAEMAIGVTDGSNFDDAGSEDIHHLDDGESPYDKLDVEYYSFNDEFLREAGERLLPV